MWRLWSLLGAGVWVATIAASASVNYLAGYEFGRTPAEAHVFAILGLSADIWKAAGPIFAVTLWRARRHVPAGLAGAVWMFCFIFAVSAALGVAARNRGAAVGGQEDLRLGYADVARDLSRLEKQRADLGEVGTPAEREAAIAATLAKPLPGGTVGSLSENCQKDHPRTRSACADVANLRQGLALAIEGSSLDQRIADLRHDRDGYLHKGATREADPQAKLISSLSLGLIPADDVGLVLILVLVCMVELISAFAPVVVHEYAFSARTRSQRVVAGRGLLRPDADGRVETREVIEYAQSLVRAEAPTGDLFEYLAERVRPERDGRELMLDLFADYCTWCWEKGKGTMTPECFVDNLDTIGIRDLNGSIYRRGSEYCGLRLTAMTRQSRAIATDKRTKRISGA